LKNKDLLSIADLTPERLKTLVFNASAIKAEGWSSLLSHKVLVLLFEKPSLRTRASFEVAMRQLGGQCFYMSPDEVRLGNRESSADVALVLSRYADAIAARTFSHHTLEVMAENASIPVINALSDLEHPCQALADLLTIYEARDKLEGTTVAFVGDGNNVANSLLLAATLTGMNFRIASPPGYEIGEGILKLAEDFAAVSGSLIVCTNDPAVAVAGADVVYTDVWASMGQEDEAELRAEIFAPYQITPGLMGMAAENAMLMHPLPAHHGEEVAEGVIYSPQSAVFDQAENRLHAQKALLADILGGLEIPLGNYH
jgi:ornithine carbamoyltransferase